MSSELLFMAKPQGHTHFFFKTNSPDCVSSDEWGFIFLISIIINRSITYKPRRLSFLETRESFQRFED